MKIRSIFSIAAIGMIMAATVSSCNSNTAGNNHGPVSDSNRNDFVKPDSSNVNPTDNQSMSNPGETYNYGDSTPR